MSTISDKSKMNESSENPPLLYYRTWEQIREYRSMPVEDKLRRLEMMAEFFYSTMPEKSKRIRDKFVKGKHT
jgi:hypothetical protein